MKNFFIYPTYKIRSSNQYFDDTPNQDQWQKEVYMYAKKIFVNNKFSKVIDVGCGSAYKLLKYFANDKTLGIDLSPTVNWLRTHYPNKEWTDQFEPILNYDLIIASDIIEHMPDPDMLLDLVQSCRTKLIIFSTPDRDLLNNDQGPPNNPSHVREWNMLEFNNYIGSRFHILDHFISNREQGTQVILAKNNTNAL